MCRRYAAARSTSPLFADCRKPDRDGETDFALAFSPDGSTLATASRTRGVQLFRANDGVLITERILPLDTPRGL